LLFRSFSLPASVLLPARSLLKKPHLPLKKQHLLLKAQWSKAKPPPTLLLRLKKRSNFAPSR